MHQVRFLILIFLVFDENIPALTDPLQNNHFSLAGIRGIGIRLFAAGKKLSIKLNGTMSYKTDFSMSVAFKNN